MPLFTAPSSTRSPQNKSAAVTALCFCVMMACGAFVLTGCGEDKNDLLTTLPTDPHPSPVSDTKLIDDPVVTKKFSAAELAAAIKAAGLSGAITADPICGITVQYINHTTRGLQGEPTNATGAVIVPHSDNANRNNQSSCQGERPILLYAHGTTPSRDYNLAALDDPNNPAYPTALLIAANFAAQGDIVIAPNYPGYDQSDLDYAPYVTLQQGKQMLDGLQAGKLALDQLASRSDTNAALPPVTPSDKLFVTGYSQGGYVAMATAKALDDIGQPATAVSPASGPYAITAFADSIMSGNVIYGGTVFLPMLLSSYESEYSNLTQGVYADQYAQSVPKLFPTNEPLMTLFLSGQLPTTALFESRPTDYDSLAPLSPPIPRLSFGFSPTNYLFNTDFRAKYIQDMTNYPDGIYPVMNPVDPAAPTNTDLPLRQAFIANDLRDYLPKSPMLLCGGNQDPSVTFDVNAAAQARIWQSAATQPFALIDVDISNAAERKAEEKLPYISTLPSSIDNTMSGTATALQTQFTTALDTLLTNSAQAAYAEARDQGMSEADAQAAAQQASYANLLSNYHGMVAPYCLSAANVFFDQYR